MYKFTLNENFNWLKEFLLDIKDKFKSSQNSLHKVRNEIKLISQNDTEVVVKSFKIPNIFNKILYFFGKKTKAQKSYEHALRIENFTPKPIGYIEFYEHKLLCESFFVSENFAYDFTIREVLLDDEFLNKDSILKQFVAFTYALHEQEILHLDYSPGNILIKQSGDRYEFKVVDINRMKFKKLKLKDRLKNFSMLWATDEDMKSIAVEYAKLSNADESRCIDMAMKYSHRLKARKNLKKRLKGQKC
ncbi:lipopolysaccharide kinase InaA family protein [Campylobacter suis]|uniref:Protein kinase domain-containing protein n=1 Tax=Campylobacter suis TaxID=2790657 RepID=A0ABM8Q118_9BACT|nr:lipopolysaccharide kinase InaA family protein [Campylobacter suis]CAD7286474.1 hypothetical protein LMG8286_00307 [Campylobacter suis]